MTGAVVGAASRLTPPRWRAPSANPPLKGSQKLIDSLAAILPKFRTGTDEERQRLIDGLPLNLAAAWPRRGSGRGSCGTFLLTAGHLPPGTDPMRKPACTQSASKKPPIPCPAPDAGGQLGAPCR
jgi:hypothetical protein